MNSNEQAVNGLGRRKFLAGVGMATFAGGLSPENIVQAIRAVSPFAVDR